MHQYDVEKFNGDQYWGSKSNALLLKYTFK